MLARRLQGLLALGDRDLQRDDAVGAFFRATADAFVALGLRDAGYRHLQIDDCWMTAARGARGEQLVDASKFPDGMSNLTAHLRGAGFKAGIYTATGNRTCAERAGSCGAFGVDTAQYAAWGFEYLKVDSCGGCSGGHGGHGRAARGARQRHRRGARPAVLAAGAPFHQRQRGER